MKLRNKLFIRIFIVLFLQVCITGGITIVTFYNQTQESSKEELLSSWVEVKNTIELLKHRLYMDIHFIKFYLGGIPESEFTYSNLRNRLYPLYGALQVDRIIILNSDNSVIADVSGEETQDNPDFISSIDHSHFEFPRNEFIITDSEKEVPKLFLVTGAPFIKENRKLFYIYTAIHINKSYIEDTFFIGMGINVAFFAGSKIICSDLPFFTFPVEKRGQVLKSIILSSPYYGINNVISADIPGYLHLVVLKSALSERLYLERIRDVIIIAFFITLAASFLLAAGLTSLVISPFSRFQKWLETYMQTGVISSLNITSRDETGYLAKTFHSMVKKLIKEEQIIKNQLKEISFLNRYNEIVVNNLQAGVIVVNDRGSIEYVNPYFCTLVNRRKEKLVGENITNVFTDIFILKTGDLKKEFFNLQKKTHISNILYKQENGDTIKFVAKMIPIEVLEKSSGDKILIVLEDITKTERLWQKILVTEKIASLGMLSAGMAHEINNPLGSISSHVNYLLEVEKNKEKLDSIKWIDSETQRISSIIGRVLSFAQSSEEELKADMNQVIRESVKLLKYELKQNRIKVEMDLKEKLPPIKISVGGLKQILLNLFINSRQAMPEGGLITIKTYMQNDYAILEIRDTGKGIRPEYISRVFDPFFSTKPAGEGVGLGLSIAYSIIERAGGSIRIENTDKKGSLFYISFCIINDGIENEHTYH